MKFRLILTLAVPVVLLVAVAFANRARTERIERIAQQDVEIFSPNINCLERLSQAIQQNPYTYRFRVGGYIDAFGNSKLESLDYNRQHCTLRHSLEICLNGSCSQSQSIYENVNDALVLRFMKETPGRSYEFDGFCQSHGCRVRGK